MSNDDEQSIDFGEDFDQELEDVLNESDDEKDETPENPISSDKNKWEMLVQASKTRLDKNLSPETDTSQDKIDFVKARSLLEANLQDNLLAEDARNELNGLLVTLSEENASDTLGKLKQIMSTTTSYISDEPSKKKGLVFRNEEGKEHPLTQYKDSSKSGYIQPGVYRDVKDKEFELETKVSKQTLPKLKNKTPKRTTRKWLWEGVPAQEEILIPSMTPTKMHHKIKTQAKTLVHPVTQSKKIISQKVVHIGDNVLNKALKSVIQANLDIKKLRQAAKTSLITRFSPILGQPKGDLIIEANTVPAKMENEESDSVLLSKLEKVVGTNSKSFIVALSNKYSLIELWDKRKQLKDIRKKIKHDAKKVLKKAMKSANIEIILDDLQERYGKNFFDLSAFEMRDVIKSAVKTRSIDLLILDVLTKLQIDISYTPLAEILMKVIYRYSMVDVPLLSHVELDLIKNINLNVKRKKVKALKTTKNPTPKRIMNKNVFIGKSIDDFEESSYKFALTNKSGERTVKVNTKTYLDVDVYLNKISQPMIFSSSDLAKVLTMHVPTNRARKK